MWKSFFSAFILVFLAELGDKTQLSTMLLASRSNSIWIIFVGSACALILSSFICVFAGTFINRYIPASYIQICSGVTFILIGIFLISGKL